MPQSPTNRLIAQLQAVQSTATVANPYLNPNCSSNLRVYLRGLLKYPYSGHLLVGEAPGHRGCALTGIPFTSERVLATGQHPFVTGMRSAIVVANRVTESTATIVWSHLETCNSVPAFWNVFPFHPHKPTTVKSNRAPTRAEVESGRKFLDLVIEILSPEVIVAVGSTAQQAFGRLNTNIKPVTVRHPSYGGKEDFIIGITELGIV